MVTLYITRHGQTEWNVQKRMQGWFDSPLTLQGKQDASALAGRLSTIPFKAAYVSSSGRTVDTAKIICHERRIPLFFKHQLKEIDVGEWQGLTADEIKSDFPEQYDAYYNDSSNYYSNEGENFQQVLDRALSVITDIQSDYEDDDHILIVTHAVVKKLLICHFKNLAINHVWDPPFIHGTSLTVVKLTADQEPLFEKIGCTDHFPMPILK